MMKSAVSKLYDRSQITVPREMVKWRISDEDIEKQLVVLSRTYGTDVRTDKVQKGDSVRLSCNEGSMKGRVILIFPGLNLPGVAEAESSVLGCAVGDSITAVLNGACVTLTVEEILRRIPADIDDELVKKERQDGVNTLDEYRCRYRERREAQNRNQAQKDISGFVLREIIERSEYALDYEELEAWKDENARAEFEECIEDGEDPRITEEGEEPLTDEEAIEMIKEEIEPRFKMELVCRALCEAQGISLGWENLKDEFEEQFPPELAAILSEEEMEQSKADFMENAAITKVYDFLFDEAAAYLEE